MVNKNYKRGRRWEYYVRNWLLDRGWFVVRSAGSHGIDLVAIKKIDNEIKIRFISCKINSGLLTKREKDELLNYAEELNIEPYVAYKEGRKKYLHNIKTKIRFRLK